MKRNKLYYIIDKSNWSIKWDGYYITKYLNYHYNLKAKTKNKLRLIKNSIIHYGYPALLFDNISNKRLLRNNYLISTFFHIADSYKANIDRYIEQINNLNYIHTSSTITKNKLIEYGVKKEKIVQIPLGVDTKIFVKKNDIYRKEIRKKLGIPEDSIVIGSFQKDGSGWGQGLEPKLIKGPDIFCDVIEKLSREFDVFILLSGPARGYVKQRLKDTDIKYKHIFLKNYYDIVELYNSLDLYIISSRNEGGPKAILESWATGVPVVSTKVGMAPDIIRNKENGLLCEIDNVEQIFNAAKNILRDEKLKGTCIKNGLKDVKQYDWSLIARQYYEKMYKNLLF